MCLQELSKEFPANGLHDTPIFMPEQHISYMFIRFVCVAPYFNNSAYKLAVSDVWTQFDDGWAQVGDGWANAHPGPPLAIPVFNIVHYTNLFQYIFLSIYYRPYSS